MSYLFNVAELQEYLSECDVTTVAKETGLSFPTVNNIARGRKVNPTIDTLQRLSDWVDDNFEV